MNATRFAFVMMLTVSATACGDDTCGNSVRDDGEVCDGSALKGLTCARLGFDGGSLSCAPGCDGFDTSGCTRTSTCGDSEIDAPEVCDGSNLNGMECSSFSFVSGTLACATDCQTFDLSSCVALCGDGIVEAPELCDGGNLHGESCLSLDYLGGDLACASDCLSFDVADCASEASCGNDRRETPEACDGSDLDDVDCATFGFAIGTLACQTDCSGFDVSGCVAGHPCVDSLDCPTSARRCHPDLSICVQCLADDDCSCHQVCEDRACVAIGAPSLEHQWNAHGTWASAPGLPDYRATGTCGTDVDCAADELCNPFTAGCVSEQRASMTCTGGACPGGMLCDARTDRCFPAGLCFDNRNCCGLTGVTCAVLGGSVGLCQPTECTPPETPTSICPFEPGLTDECSSGFCSPTGQCVECTCDAECLDGGAPRCDEVGGVCVRDDFCRSVNDCGADSACNRTTQSCVPWCDAHGECAGGELCDFVDHVCRCRPDDHEPNDAVDATLLPALPVPSEGNELSATGTLCADEDWFTMAVEAGNRIRIVAATPSDLTARVEVIAPNQTTVIAGDQLSGTAIVSFELLIEVSGSHYLRLAPISGHGDYQLHIHHVSPLECDVGGPNDDVASAAVLNSPSAPVPEGCSVLSGDLNGAHTLSCADALEICVTDVDYYLVHLPDNSQMNLTVGNFTGPDLDLTLFGPFDAVETPDTSRLLMIANTDDPTEVVSATTRGEANYLVLVDSLFADSSRYDLLLEVTAATTDPTCTEDRYDEVSVTPEPFDVSGWNDTVATASGLIVDPATPTIASMNMCTADVDWLVVGHDDTGTLVAVPPGHRLEATVTPQSGPADDLVVFGGVDPVVVAAAAVDTAAGSQTLQTTSTGELIYLVVAAKPAVTLPRPYQLEISEIVPPNCDLDDLGDLSSTVRNDSPVDATVLGPPWPAALGDPPYSFPAAPGDALTSCAADDDWYRIDGITDTVTASILFDAGVGELSLVAYDNNVESATIIPGVPPTDGVLDLSAEDGTGLQSISAQVTGGPLYLLVSNRSGWPLDYALTTEVTAIMSVVDPANVAIPEGSGPTFTCGAPGALFRAIEVTATGYVADVDVQVDITDSAVGNLDIFLEVENHGTPLCVELSTGNGSIGDNLTGTIFDDQGALSIVDGFPPFTGRFRPETPLAALNNAAVDGKWTLWVSDMDSFSSGTLDSWSLTIERRATLQSPTAPFDVAAIGTDATVTISWAPVASATSYDVVWAQSAGVTSTTGTPVMDVASPWSHTPVTNGTSYYYVVVAHNSVGQSPDSIEVSATPAPVVIYAATPNLTIPDNGAISGATCDTKGGASSSVVVTETGTVIDVDVAVNVAHTYDNDLEILLEFDNGGSPLCIDLSRRHGGSGDGYIDTVFDDAASTMISNGMAPFTGSFIPQAPLSTLNGLSMTGTWTLHVFDVASQDEGTLQSWELAIRY